MDTYILLGATGDLAKKKIFPALLHLYTQGLLSRDFRILAQGRTPMSDEEFRQTVSHMFHDDNHVSDFVSRIDYLSASVDESKLYETIARYDKSCIHLSIAPVLYEQVLNSLGTLGYKGKILIEKPFGTDLASAERLNSIIDTYFTEDQVFRIDHYLGKIGVQAIAGEIQSNPQLKNKINNQHITKIECRLREVVDVGSRGEFYDHTGA